MIFAVIFLYNIFNILKNNRLWVPFFFITAYHFFSPTFLYLMQATPLLVFSCLVLGYVFHYFKLKYDTSKITFNDKKYFIINADTRFPIGTFMLLQLFQSMPEILLRSFYKMHATNSAQLQKNIEFFIPPLLKYSLYVNIFALGYFCSLGIYFMHKSISMPSKK